MDKEYNMCEVVWVNDAVQRLLSFLRQAQTTCTENECYPTTRLPGPQSGQLNPDVFMMTIVFGVIALLYFFRPNSLRQTSFDAVKPCDNASDSNDDPPVPPPSAN